MNLVELISNKNENYEETLLVVFDTYNNSCGYVKKISTIDEDSGEKKYGLNYVILENKGYDLPDVYANNIVSMQYKNISEIKNYPKINVGNDWLYPVQFETNDDYKEIKLLRKSKKEFTTIDFITKEDKVKYIVSLGSPEFYLVGMTEEKKYSLFDINIIKDKENNYSSKIHYIAKNCSHYERHGRHYFIKENRDSISILEYNNGSLVKKRYSGKLISKNERFFVLKNNNEFILFTKNSGQYIATYINDSIIDMQLCQYDEELQSKDFDVVILTTKENKKKLLPIMLNNDYPSFIETEKEFDDISYDFCRISYLEEDVLNYKEGFSFNGIIENNSYRINVEPNGNIETLNLYTKKKNNPILKKTKK